MEAKWSASSLALLSNIADALRVMAVMSSVGLGGRLTRSAAIKACILMCQKQESSEVIVARAGPWAT
jgi:hypothetical protein